MQTTLPFILEILILCKRVACLMNTLNDFTVVQIIYESNMVQRECYNLVPSEIQYPCKQHSHCVKIIWEQESYKIKKGNKAHLFQLQFQSQLKCLQGFHENISKTNLILFIVITFFLSGKTQLTENSKWVLRDLIGMRYHTQRKFPLR